MSWCLLGGVGAVPSWGGSAPVGRGADSRGEWVLLSRGPPIADVPGPWGCGGVSPTGQLYQRNGCIGPAHAGGAAPAAGAGSGGNAGSGGCAGGGGCAAALPGAAVLEKDVGAQLVSGLASVEQCGAALRVAGSHIGAVLEGGNSRVTVRPPCTTPARRSPRFPGPLPLEIPGFPRLAVFEMETSKTLYPTPIYVPTAAAA